MLDLLMQNLQVRRVREMPTIQIPDLDNAETLLWTNSHTHDLVLCILGAVAQSGRCQIALEYLHRVTARDLETVGTTVDVRLILPQRRILAAHHTEQTIRGLVRAELTKETA